MKATLIIGLPGSGKTYLGNKLSQNFIDDPKTKPVPSGDNLVIADPHLCLTKNLEAAITYLESLGYNVSCIYFENNPKQCIENVLARNDGRQVLSTIDFYSKLYKVPENVVPLKVWKKGEKSMQISLPEEIQSRRDYQEACKTAFREFMQKKQNHVLIEHIRHKNSEQPPIGVVVAYLNDDGNIVVGWSLRHHSNKSNDIYMKHDGFVRAINRATDENDSTVPHSIKNRVADMWTRSQKYFKVQVA